MEKTKRTIEQLDIIGKKKLFNINMGIFLRSARLKNNFTQTNVANKLDSPVTFQQVQKYEKGINMISVMNFSDFCKRCNITEHFELILAKCHDNFYLRKLLDEVPELKIESYKDEIIKAGISYKSYDKLIDIY